MNKTRRVEIENLVDDLNAMQERIQMLRSEEQDYCDNMPEASQQREKGEKAETAVNCSDQAESSIEEAVNGLEEALNA